MNPLATTLAATLSFATIMCAHPNYIAYVGCYSNQDGGIHVLEVNPNDGTVKKLGLVDGIADPTWILLNRDKTKLYAGICSLRGKVTQGGVAAFDIDGQTLRFTSHQPSGGTKPCHVALDADEKAAFAANYSEGTGAAFNLDHKGDILPEYKHITHTGRGPHPTRQEKAHVHCAQISPDQKFLYFVDLGLDNVLAYDYDNGKGNLERVPEADIKARPGAGPRHLLFTRRGDVAYVINELDSTVAVYTRDGIRYQQIQVETLLPEAYNRADGNTASAIKITQDGTRLLCSNRGHDSIAVFDVNPENGTLTRMAINPTLGRGPRDFEFLPGDDFILVAHQYTHNLVCFKFNRQTGAMTPVGKQLVVPQGVCIKIGAPVKD